MTANAARMTTMERLLKERRFLVSAELTPPRHYDLEKLLTHARNMAPCVDVLQINDHLLSQARCANMAVGHFVKQAGIEPPHTVAPGPFSGAPEPWRSAVHPFLSSTADETSEEEEEWLFLDIRPEPPVGTHGCPLDG